ncbi:hypothetical protein MKA27_17405 [[Clostridium] innocuum]|uniref:hypothetical protein n=1 Tax=Clostridium innocuum TaxID=1522 RepID=UPI000D6C3E81|nr:hypothetical protein [[Clostridium] innocuum]MCR0315842.1 hypothetical protein [[Clostridium] innocuum]MCR0370957.1 hypothetical protein [[Clostridium] innocuum]MCR0375589.1 hypothetical protein [[Clostridium] innocuum]MCR0560933.1 hypothetical protein [[Clostridium] innocuum]MCR0603707.1 hypothetical protein [[Clostridium] innocuum]
MNNNYRFLIDIWSVEKDILDAGNSLQDSCIKVSNVETWYCDNLIELLLWLKGLGIKLEHINSFNPYDFKKMDRLCKDMWYTEICFANVYHNGNQVKFSNIFGQQIGFPPYTACGLRPFSKKTYQRSKSRRIYRKVKHRAIYNKAYSHAKLSLYEMEDSEYYIPKSSLSELKKKPYYNTWDLYDKIRSCNSRTWKSYKIKRQWEKNRNRLE